MPGKILEIVVKRGDEKMGRFKLVGLNGKTNKQVVIITSYMVCKAGSNIGPHTLHMQQVNTSSKKE